MPGLLDMFLNPSPEQSQGLLAAAAKMLEMSGPSLMPHSFGQIAGGAYGAYNDSVQQAQDRQQQQTLYALKLKSLQGEVDDQQQARQRNMDFDAAARSSVLTPEQQSLLGGGGPTIANAAKIPNLQGGFDTDGFINKAMGIDPLRALQLAQSFKKSQDEFDPTPRTGTHADGTTFQYLTSKQGNKKILDDTLPRDEMKIMTLGGKDVAYNPFALQPGQTFQRTVSPDTAANNALGYARLNFDKSQANSSDTTPLTGDAIENAARRYNIDGTLPPMGMGSSGTQGRAAILNKAAELGVTAGVSGNQQRWDQLNNKSVAAARTATLRDFSPAGKSGQALTAANTALNHLATIRQLAQAQMNGDIPAFNRIANSLAQATGNPAPTNLQAAVTMVAPEVSKAVIGTSGGQEERATFAKNFNPNAAPQQTLQGVGVIENLLGGRLTESRRAYERGTGQQDFSSTMLSPAAQAVLARAQQESPDARSPSGPIAPAGQFWIKTPDNQTFYFRNAKDLANFKLTTGLK